MATPLVGRRCQCPAQGGIAGVVFQPHGDRAVERAEHVPRLVLGGDREAEACPGGDTARRLSGYCQVVRGLDLKSADVDGVVDSPRVARTTLIGGQR